jgi:hypothetical protein
VLRVKCIAKCLVGELALNQHHALLDDVGRHISSRSSSISVFSQKQQALVRQTSASKSNRDITNLASGVRSDLLPWFKAA